MDYGITKKRKTITFEGIHQEIEKKLSMVTNFSIDIENPTLIKYIVDTISQSDYPINFVLVNDEFERIILNKLGTGNISSFMTCKFSFIKCKILV